MKKQVLSLILTLCMVIGLMTALSVPASAATSGTCGDNLTWTLTENGVLTISGTGSMADMVDPPWRNRVTSLRIENGVTSISTSAFAQEYCLTNVSIPDSVTSIGWAAFFMCESLKSISLPEGIESISEHAFSASGITSITIPSSVHTIAHSVFCACQSLTSVTFLSDSISIGAEVFAGCNNLTSVTFSNGEGVIELGSMAFMDCSKLQSIILPRGLSLIPDGLFRSCTSLSSVTIPNTVTEIKGAAFADCTAITSITLPNSISKADGAFDACSNLQNILVAEDNPYLCSDGGVLFNANKTRLICYPAKKNGTEYVIPNGITHISPDAFADCNMLASITIPRSVKGIERYAFEDCKNLTDVYYLGTLEDWNQIWMDDFHTTYDTVTVHYTNLLSKDITSKYRSELLKSNHPLSFYYSDSFFVKNDGYFYNHDLARATLALELASWTSLGNESGSESQRMENITALYNDLGFHKNSIAKYHYDDPLNDNSDKAAYSFASKPLYDGSTLVAVVVRGGGYGAEWRSNLHVGTGSKHAGFNVPAEEIYNNLDIYLSASNLDRENTKIWITGYSRGAAVANIVAGRINETGLINSNNLYAYTFATPNGVKVAETGANSSVHDNIYNIVLPYDFVPQVAMSNWGYGRYGQTLMVKNMNTSSDSNIGIHNALPHEQYFLQDTNELYSVGKSQTKAATHLRNALSVFGKNQNNYVSEYEGLMMDIIEWAMYRKGAKGEELTHFVFERYGGHEKFSDALSHAYPYMSDYSNFSFMNKLGLDSSMVYSIVLLMYMNGIEMAENETIDFIINKLSDILKELNISDLGNAEGCLVAHNPEYYIAWLYAYDNPKDIYESSTYKKLTIACPVNINVYDSAGTLVASVVDKEVIVDTLPVDVIGESAEICFYEGEDIDDYTIEIVAYDTGTVNYSITEYENHGMETRKINYHDIPVNIGTTLSGNIPKGLTLQPEVYNLTSTINDEPATITYDEDLTGDDLQNLTVDVTTEGDGTARDIYYATKGELVTLEASPYFDATFIGWYDAENRILSTELEYSFILHDNMNVVAKFSTCSVARLSFTTVPQIVDSHLSVLATLDAGKDVSGLFVASVYDENGSLLDTNITNVVLDGNTTRNFDVTFDTTKFPNAPKTVKLFLFSQSLQPICLSAENIISSE